MKRPASDPSAEPDTESLLVDLALQGGGAHGAFTWGVLDRLLEEPHLRIEGISGTSAGAMNAALVADGHADGGGLDGARTALEGFWRRVSEAARFSPLRRTPLDVLMGRWTMDTSPMFIAFDMAARVFSPYDLNPTGANPLRDILADCLDFDRVGQVADTAIRDGYQRPYRARPHLPQRRTHTGCSVGVSVFADTFSGHRNRWRAVLGRWFLR